MLVFDRTFWFDNQFSSLTPLLLRIWDRLLAPSGPPASSSSSHMKTIRTPIMRFWRKCPACQSHCKPIRKQLCSRLALHAHVVPTWHRQPLLYLWMALMVLRLEDKVFKVANKTGSPVAVTGRSWNSIFSLERNLLLWTFELFSGFDFWLSLQLNVFIISRIKFWHFSIIFYSHTCFLCVCFILRTVSAKVSSILVVFYRTFTF